MKKREPAEEFPAHKAMWRQNLHRVIFGVETRAGRGFDLVLLGCILLSILTVMLESVESFRGDHGPELKAIEWTLTLLFTVEYFLRLLSVERPRRYATSFFGIIDLLAIVPTYLSFFLAGSQTLVVIRAVRLLRVFRILKLAHFVGEAGVLTSALKASRYKITVFVGGVLTLVLLVGTAMYLIEGSEHGFTSIPISIYWAIVTLTTVGYGDITPHTIPGQILSSFVMILGYGIIAVPTGIVSVEIGRATRHAKQKDNCERCGHEEHTADARFCARCGERLRTMGDRIPAS